jgi:hypothetical protein
MHRREFISQLAGTLAAVGSSRVAYGQTSLGPLLLGSGQQFLNDNYKISASDKNKHIICSGDKYYTLAFGPPSNFDSDFSVAVSNSDTSRAKFISGVLNGTRDGFYLWPGQSNIISNQDNKWQQLIRSRWQVPFGPEPCVTFYVDPTKGSDSWGTTDGLSPHEGAFASLQYVCNAFILAQLDLGGGQALVQLTQGALEKHGVHLSSWGLVGAQGGAGLIIDGGAGIISGPIETYFGMQVMLQNATIDTSGISVNRGARLQLGSGIIFGQAPSRCHVASQDDSVVEFLDDYTLAGSATVHLAAGGGGVIKSNGVGATISENVEFSRAVAECTGGFIVGPAAWKGTGHVTGKAYLCNYNGVIIGASLMPGSVGVVETGGRIS